MLSIIHVLKACVFFPLGLLLMTGHNEPHAPLKGTHAAGRLLLITEQAQNRIVIADADTRQVIWEWRAADVRPEHVKWFSAPSDAKSVYDGKYVLMTASGGGVALIRIADKKTVFYAYAGGNTHSAELLPDGNIVTASSTASYLALFHADSLHFPDNVYIKKVQLPFAHNVVWDKKRQTLWAAGRNKLYSCKYNFNCSQPDLQLTDSTLLPDTDAHDLFPVYGQDALWLTTPKAVYTIDPSSRKIMPAKGTHTENIKSITSGPSGYPTIVTLPQEKWWSDEVLDNDGNSIFKQTGFKIYKCRWLIPASFSYPDHHAINFCR